jgi:hypothetical protein
MGSFSIAEWLIALLIVAVILGTRKLVSSLATRARALSDRGVALGVESAWPVFVYRSGKHDPRDAPGST